MALLAEGEDIKRIKAMYLPKGTKEEDLLIQQLLKNTGKQFSEIEMAKLFNRFKEQWGYTQTEIADKFCKKASFVSRCMALLDLPAEIIEMMERGEISADTARQIANRHKDDVDAQVEDAEKAVNTAKAKGKKTATTKDIPVNVQAANLIAKIRKDLKKYASLMDSLDGENAEVMMTNAINVYEQTAEWENAAKELAPKAVSEPQTAEEVNEVEKVA